MMHISGVLVHARPERAGAVREALVGMQGVEVHALTEDGRLVVTVESDGDREMADTVMGLHNVDGVLSAAMIYHHCEPMQDQGETQR